MVLGVTLGLGLGVVLLEGVTVFWGLGVTVVVVGLGFVVVLLVALFEVLFEEPR